MMPLHQQLEARLDVGLLCVGIKTERVERLALGVAHHASGMRRLRARARLAAEFGVDAERIGGVTERAIKPVRPRLAVTGLLAVEAELPGRTVSCDGVLLIARDRLVAHAGEVIVRMIVLAHVLEAEAPVLALAQAALGGAVARRAGAAGPLARRLIGGRPALLAGLHPDAIEDGRVQFHGPIIMRVAPCRLQALSQPWPIPWFFACVVDPMVTICLKHDPEKWIPVFGQDHAPTLSVERDDDSKKSHPDLKRPHAGSRPDQAKIDQRIRPRKPARGG